MNKQVPTKPKREQVLLAAGRVDAFTCPPEKAQAFLWDSKAPGFALRVTRSGKKAYIFQGRLGNSTIRVTIGSTEAWAIEDARREARRLQAMIDTGRDPRQAKAEVIAADVAKRIKAKQDNIPALEAWQVYMKARAGKWSRNTLQYHEHLVEQGGRVKKRGRKQGEPDTIQPGLLYDLLQRPLSQIDRSAVTALLTDNLHRPESARGAFVRLRAFLNWCSDRPNYAGQVHADVCNTRALKSELPKAKARQDSLQREMLKAWFDAVRTDPNRVQSVYLQVLLLTGARREEVAALKWADVDLEWNSLRIADKVEQEQGRVIPLTPYVKKLLLSIKPAPVRTIRGAAQPECSPWVFPSPTAASGHIAEPRSAHTRALRVAGLPHVSLHGLRRSFGSLAEWTETPAGVVAQIQGHKPSATAEKHYRVRPLDLLRMWHTKIEGWILEQANIEQPKVAVPKLYAIQE